MCVFSMGVLLPHVVGPALTPQHSKLRENHSKGDLKHDVKDDLAFFREESIVSPGPKEECEKSSCVWMEPHVLFCADSGAPILKHTKHR